MTEKKKNAETTNTSPNPPVPEPKPGTLSEPGNNTRNKPLDYERGVVHLDQIKKK